MKKKTQGKREDSLTNKERAEERLLTADEGDERVFVEGMLEVYKSVRTYIARYADAAEKAGKTDCAGI